MSSPPAPRRGSRHAGPSHIFERLLRGETTSERYVAVVKRAVRMQTRRDFPELYVSERVRPGPGLACLIIVLLYGLGVGFGLGWWLG